MSGQTYPDSPGHRGVDTSIEAAEDIAPRVGRLQKMALDHIGAAAFHGCTCDELATKTGVDYASIQPRTSELRKQGLIKDSKRRRVNSKGKNVIVWVLPEYVQAA